MKKYSVHYTFIIVLILAFMIGLLKELSLIFLVLLLHELGHLFFIKLFDRKIKKITFYPFGGEIIYDRKNDFIYKSILITIGGICSNLIFYMLFKLFDLKLLSNLNLYFIFINLLPIYPLDGGKLLIYVLSILIPYKMSKYIVHYVSIFFSIILFILLISKTDGIYFYLIFLFFIRNNIKELFDVNKEYQMFLLMKHLNPNEKMKDKITNKWCSNPIENIFMGRKTIFNFETFLVEEKIILKNHFINKKRLN